MPLSPYSYDNFVAPEFRGKGVPSSFRHERRVYLRENGFVWSIGDVWPENAPAWKRGLRRGRNPVGVLARVRLGPWSRVFVRPIRGADHPPRLRLVK